MIGRRLPEPARKGKAPFEHAADPLCPESVPESRERLGLARASVRAVRPLQSETLRISVIIPCFNAVITLPAQLTALAGQNWPGWWEVVVVDNGSRDGSAPAAETCAARLGLTRCRVITAPQRRGAGYARNVGAAHAIGDVLAFVDADDEVGSGWLSAMAEAIVNHEVVASRLEYHKLNRPWARRMRGHAQAHGLQSYRHPEYLPHAAGAGLVVRREVHEALRGFDESMWMLEDTDYCWRAQLAGVRLSYAPEAIMHYRLRGSVRSGCRQARQWAQYNVKLYKRYRLHGMRRISWYAGLRCWGRLLVRVGELSDEQRRPRWLWEFNWAVGRLYGSLKYRVFAL